MPTQVTITGNSDNRIITGGSGVNLNGESNFTFDGDEVAVYANTDDTDCILHLVGYTASGGVGQAGRTAIIAESTHNSNGQSSMHLRTRNTSNAQLIAMTLDGNQNVGIGTQLPLSRLHVVEGDSGLSAPGVLQDTVFIENSANAGITIATPNTNTGYLTFADPEDDNVGMIIYRHGGSKANSMGFFVNAEERLHIDSSGRLKIGNISDYTVGVSSCPMYIRMTTDLTATNTAEGSANTGLLRIEETGSNANRYHGIELRNRQSGDIRLLNKDVDTSDRGDIIIVMPSGASSPAGLHQKMRFNSIEDSIQIAGKGGAVLAGSNTEKTDIYISTITGVTAVNTQAGDAVAGLIRFEDKGTSNGRYHGIELRNKDSGDARILNKGTGSTNTSQMWFAVDGKNKSTDSNDIREALVINDDMVVSGKKIMNRNIDAGGGNNCWTTSGAWKVLCDLNYYPNNCLYICDAAMQRLAAYTATFWVYKTRQDVYKVIHDQDSLCHWRINGSQLELQQNSGADQTDTFGYQKIFMAPFGMDYDEDAVS